MVTGWNASYPETTGYIVPTMLDCAHALNREELRDRARRMLDWLVSIQMSDGAFQGGTVEAAAVVPVAFNTGQILMGLAAGARAFESDTYAAASQRAADWLVSAQDADGSWRRFQSPHAMSGEKTYDTHVAWGLFEAARVRPDQSHAEAAVANVEWALGHQNDRGWFSHCCLTDPAHPLTHTIGYVLRGVLEAYAFTKEEQFLAASRKTADGILGAMGGNGFIPGRLSADWRSTATWSCLTGTAQIAICWLLLYRFTGEPRYRDAAYAANRYLRRTVDMDGDPDVRGGVKGSFPIDGGYNKYCYLNWACKFFIDSNLLEMSIREEEGSAD
jgi:rhamnogalacturonyl hydrolase YesR